jgi:hypothetical protein
METGPAGEVAAMISVPGAAAARAAAMIVAVIVAVVFGLMTLMRMLFQAN